MSTHRVRPDAIVFAVGFVPMTAVYFLQLWDLPHYQFFPWALLGAGALAARSSGTQHSESPPRLAWSHGLVGLSLLLLTTSVLLDSPWLGYAAAQCVLWTFVYETGGRNACRRFLPAGLMLLTTLRLPLGTDLGLIAELQQLTARAAGEVLDTFDLTHFLSGNVIVVPGRRLLVEEACSGVNSFLSAGCGALFWLLWNRRSWLFSALLLLSVPLWVVVANTVRVTLTTVLRVKYDIAADEGRLHDALGLGVFTLAMLLILSTERLLHFYAALVGDEPADKPDAAPATPPRRGTLRPYLVPACASGFLLLVQLPTVVAQWREVTFERGAVELAEVDSTLITPALAGWGQAKFELVRRDRGSAIGERSQVWKCERGDASLVVSIDYPFSGWHELTECYEMQGWRAESRQIDNAAPQIVEARLHDDRDHRRGVLLFCMLNRQGRIASPRRYGELEEFVDRFLLRWKRLLGAGEGAQLDRGTRFQVQLYWEAYHPPSDAELAEVRAMMGSVVTQLSQAWPQIALQAGEAARP